MRSQPRPHTSIRRQRTLGRPDNAFAAMMVAMVAMVAVVEMEMVEVTAMMMMQ